MNVLPATSALVTGSSTPGVAGVFAAVRAPVSTSAVPSAATSVKSDRSNASSAALAPAFEIYTI